MKPEELSEIARAIDPRSKYVKGFLVEKTGKEQQKNMPIFKLKQVILLRDDCTIDLNVICVLNNTMLLKTAEVFISKFLDSAWGKLARQVGVKVNN